MSTASIPGIYCLLGGYIIPTTYYQNQNNPLIDLHYVLRVMRPPWFLLDTEEERGQNSWEVLGFHHGYGQKQMVGVALASSSRQLCLHSGKPGNGKSTWISRCISYWKLGDFPTSHVCLPKGSWPEGTWMSKKVSIHKWLGSVRFTQYTPFISRL